MIVGHDRVLSRLPKQTPPTVLLLGPEGVGKRKIAHQLARRTGAVGLDLQELGHLDMTGARQMIAHHSIHPISCDVRVTVADLSKSRPDAQHAILKTLEEPPSYSHIILHSDREPLLTIKSRCFTLRFGALKTEDIMTILTDIGVSDVTTEQVSERAQGRVSKALGLAHHPRSAKDATGVLKAFEEHSAPALEAALSKAMEAERSEKSWVVTERREVTALLLAEHVRTSFAKTNAFSEVPVEARTEALRILESRMRAPLKIRNAVWLMALAS